MHSVPDFKQDRQLAAVRILLLEDDEVFAGLVRSNLEYADWGDLSIAHAATLRDALAWLEDGGFDLVITDLNLPDSKGLDTVESLVRATDRLIVVLTGERDEGLREAAIAQGAYDLMSKDRLDRAELGQLVRLAAMQAKTFSSLRKSEQRYRSLMELSADWYWEQDAELRAGASLRNHTSASAGGNCPTPRSWARPGRSISRCSRRGSRSMTSCCAAPTQTTRRITSAFRADLFLTNGGRSAATAASRRTSPCECGWICGLRSSIP
jgi:DNA-binding NarL/FixJ family response regulator